MNLRSVSSPLTLNHRNNGNTPRWSVFRSHGRLCAVYHHRGKPTAATVYSNTYDFYLTYRENMSSLPMPIPSALDARTQAFPLLTAAQISRVRPGGKLRDVRKGEILFEPGDTNVPFFVLLSGSMEIVQPDLTGKLEDQVFRYVLEPLRIRLPFGVVSTYLSHFSVRARCGG